MITASASAPAPKLVRTLGLRSLVLFGLAYMTPMIVLGIFGVIAAQTAGASASAYLIALVATLFTASSYGRMAAAYPVAGSAYTYVRRTIDPRVESPRRVRRPIGVTAQRMAGQGFERSRRPPSRRVGCRRSTGRAAGG
ncbi:hypothetical protein [Nocardia gipuzkoensis]|uniref:hypothetical protein n=1 Tax=Nocardia gipuzkoensis TaxID=2749991 RepID=UPI003EE32C62